LGNAQIAIEAKGKEKISANDLKGLRQFKQDYPDVKQRIIVSLEKKARLTQDGVRILPYQEFLKILWKGEII